jgi:hypothetical protein
LVKRQSYEWLVKDYTENNEGFLVDTKYGPIIVKLEPCSNHYNLEGTGSSSLGLVLGCKLCRDNTIHYYRKQGIDIPILSQKGNLDSPDYYYTRYSSGELGLIYDDQTLVRPEVKTSLPDYIKGLK